jgi:hypothetical protein
MNHKSKIETTSHFDHNNILKFEIDFENFMGPMAHQREYSRLLNIVHDFYSEKNTKEIKNLIKKIQNFIKRTGGKLTVEDWINKIYQKDEAALALFSVQPKRQGSSKEYGSQQFQINVINSLIKKFKCEVESLSSCGQNSFRIHSGTISKGVSKDSDTSSSLDSLTITDNGLRIFNIMKVTHSIVGENDKGGMQNHQLENATTMIDSINFDLLENKNIYIILVLDGKFYVENKILQSLIKKYKNNNNVYFTTSYKYQDVLGSILHD